MTKYKVGELDCAALDAAVAKALGHNYSVSGGCVTVMDWQRHGSVVRGNPFEPSRNWCQGGPIIERERDAICKYLIDTGESITWIRNADLAEWMRAYVASRFGDEVELP